MTRGELIKIVLAACLGGAVTYVAGPIAKRMVDRNTYGSYWAGEWDTIACHEDGYSSVWKIQFEQDGDVVAGRYLGNETGVESQRGRMSGEVKLTELTGDWSQHSARHVIGGAFVFSMYDDGNAFDGLYTSGDKQRIWNGRRDGQKPEC